MVAVAFFTRCRIDNYLQLLIIFPLIWSSANLPRALAFHPSKLKFSTSSLGISNLVNMLFPEEEISEVDPEQVLASFEMQTLTDPKDVRKTYDSLTNFLQLWGRNLELRPDKGLTTPITATDFRNATYSYVFLEGSSSATEAEKADRTETVISRPEIPANVSMTLKFRPPKRYLSYKEQKSMEKGVLPDRKGAKVDAWSPGGVLLLVHVIEQRNASATSIHYEPSWQLVLQARRCDIDGDTVIKYSSERAIVRRLKEAMRIWRKVREMP